jgi:outer membrane protein assembly factor BamB
VTGELVLWNCGYNELCLSNREDGEFVWAYSASARLAGSVSTSKGLAYFTDGNGRLHSVLLESGEFREWKDKWREDLGGPGNSTPIFSEGTLYVTAQNQEQTRVVLFAIDAESGSQKWSHESAEFPSLRAEIGIGTSTPYWKEAFGPSPALSGEHVVYAAFGGPIHAVHAETGEEVWKASAGDHAPTSVSVADGVIYIGNRDGHLYALDAETGKLKWKFDAGSPVTGDPAIHDGLVLFGCEDGALYALK